MNKTNHYVIIGGIILKEKTKRFLSLNGNSHYVNNEKIIVKEETIS